MTSLWHNDAVGGRPPQQFVLHRRRGKNTADVRKSDAASIA